MNSFVAALLASAAAPTGNILDLECLGTAQTIEYGDTEIVLDQAAVVRMSLQDTFGEADLPRFIGGAKVGRLSVKGLTYSDALITGKIWYKGIGNAKMRIDRGTGTVAITGPQGNFSGVCAPYDPSKATRKF